MKAQWTFVGSMLFSAVITFVGVFAQQMARGFSAEEAFWWGVTWACATVTVICFARVVMVSLSR